MIAKRRGDMGEGVERAARIPPLFDKIGCEMGERGREGDVAHPSFG